MRTRGLSHPAWHTHLPRRLRQHHGVARRPRRDTTDARRPRCQPPGEHGAVELWGNTIYARRPRRDTTDARRPRCQPPLAQCGSGRRSQHSGGRWSGQIIRSASTALSTLNRRWLRPQPPFDTDSAIWQWALHSGLRRAGGHTSGHQRPAMTRLLIATTGDAQLALATRLPGGHRL